MTRRSSWLGIGCGLLIVLTGCGSTATGSDAASSALSGDSGDFEPTSTATAGSSATSTATAVPTAAASSTAVSSAAAASSIGSAATPVVVPVTTMPDSGGNPKVVVDISVGGGAAVPVILDTGSSGLLIDQAALGGQVDSTGSTPVTKQYLGAALSGSLVQAPVTIGSVSTPAIGVVAYDAATSPTGLTGGGIARGVLGIASEGVAGTAPYFSPAMQLPAPYGDMSTLELSTSGAGSWTLGPVSAPAGADSVPLVPVAGATGLNRWAKDMQLCWTFAAGTNATCGPTDLDSGASSVLVNSTSAAASTASAATAGTAVSLGDANGKQLWTFAVSDASSVSEIAIESLGSATEFNTGVGFYFDHLVSFDYAGGHALISSR